jgi:acyl-ACP thioesterase
MICDPANPKASGIVDVWQETFPVRFGAIDKSDRLTMDAVFQYFQEAAICHAENLGVGREEMARTGQVWILSRISALINRRPKYNETVTVRTWPCGGEKLFAMRDFDIRDKDDNAAVSGRSAWLILDMEKRRPLRPQSVMDKLPKNEGLYALSPEAGGAAALAEQDNLKKASERKAFYTDIDYNGHVNNVRYVQWIEDTIGSRLFEKAEKMRLDINYMNEILGDEVVKIMYTPIEDENHTPSDDENAGEYAFAFEGKKKENGETAFRAELRLWL